jgi:GDP-L-fucose synthase
MNLKKNDKIFLAGHNGMVGSAILRALRKKGYKNIITKEKKKLNLENQKDVNNFFKKEKIDFVFLAAAKVGGIYANNVYPADFITQNLLIQTHVIKAAHSFGVKKMLFIGSSCVYPVITSRKIKENDLLTDRLEPTNEPYALAKIAGIKMCESFNRQYGTDYRSIMPTNLFGPGDNFHPTNSHVMAALIRKFIIAKKNNLQIVDVWGTGNPRREFLYIDDMADVALLISKLTKEKYKKITKERTSHINVGSGKDYSIKQIANLISKSVNFKGKIRFDLSKEDGVKRKLLSGKILKNLGWKSKYSFEKKLNSYIKIILNGDYKKILKGHN